MTLNEAQGDITKVIGAFTVFKFIKLMSTPFNQMKAYKYGIIDSKGNFLKKTADLKKDSERQSVDIFNRLIINLKKIIEKVPDPKFKAQMKNIATAMILVKEESEKVGADGDYVLSEITKYLSTKGIDVAEIEINNSFEELLEEYNNDK
jgi:hypothetical protein